jgi:hypothetical protein
MKRVPYTYFQRPDPITGRIRKSRYMVPVEELPKDAEAIGAPVIRELPEPGDEPTSGQWVSPSGRRD